MPSREMLFLEIFQLLQKMESKLLNELDIIHKEIHDMAEDQSQLDSEITDVGALVSTLQTTLQSTSSDIISQVTLLESKLNAGASPNDLTNEIASLKGLGQTIGSVSSGLQKLDASVVASSASSSTTATATNNTSAPPQNA